MSEHTPDLDIRFDDNANLSIFFEGEWTGWETVWTAPEYDKTKRFRAFRKKAAQRIAAYISACAGIPDVALEAYKDAGLWKHLMNCPAVTQ